MLDKITNLLLYFGLSFIGAYGVWYSFTDTNGSLIAALMVALLLGVGKVASTKDKILANIFDLYSIVFTLVFLNKLVTIETFELKYATIFAGLAAVSAVQRFFFSKSISSITVLVISVAAVAGLLLKYVLSYIDTQYLLVSGSLIAFILGHLFERFSSNGSYDQSVPNALEFVYSFLLLIICANALSTDLLGSGTLFFNLGMLFILTTFIVVFNNVKFSIILGALYFLAYALVDIYQLSNLGLVQIILIVGFSLIALSLALKQLKRYPMILNTITNKMPSFIKDLRLDDNYGYILELFKK